MAKFRYRMQNILNVKEKLETQAKNEFAIAAAKVREEEEKLDALNKRVDDMILRLKELYLENLDIAEIKECEDAVELLKYHFKLQQLNLEAANRELEAARERLTEAMQERKTHEKLKEKQFEQFVKDEASKESKEIDELVSYRFGNGEG